jgi:hypothetical protein
MRIKANCKKCNHPYLGGENGCCDNCNGVRLPCKEKKRLLCLCGKRAARVVIGKAFSPEDEPVEVETPLCWECLELEIELENEEHHRPYGGNKNPIQIVVVQSLPRTKMRLTGRRL